MICGSQLHKTDIDGWLDFIFLNIKIDLLMCIDCSSKGGIWHILNEKKFELINKVFLLQLAAFLYTPVLSG